MLHHGLAIEVIRLGHHGTSIAAALPIFLRSKVVQTVFHTRVRLVGDAIITAPIAVPVGQETSGFFCAICRKSANIVAIGVGLVGDTHPGNPRIGFERGAQGVHRELTPAKESGTLRRGNHLRSKQAFAIEGVNVAGDRRSAVLDRLALAFERQVIVAQ